MKKRLASFGWILLLLPFLSVAGTSTFLHSAEPVTAPSEERTVSNFHAVASSGSFDVYITIGTKEQIRIEADEDQLRRIETKVENGTLKINYKQQLKRQRSYNTTRAKVYIIAKSIDGLSESGSGDIKVDGDIRGESLVTKVSGSGSITFTANVSRLSSAISGSGDIAATGSSNTSEISISGSGDFAGKNLKSKKADIKISGSGSVKTHVTDDLNAVIRGSGDIYYSGDPAIHQMKTGSGKVSKI